MSDETPLNPDGVPGKLTTEAEDVSPVNGRPFEPGEPGYVDPVDQAIAATEPEGEHHWTADFTFDKDGSTMRLKVPIDFDSDKFETAVVLLAQLRVASDQRKAAMNPIITAPKPPTLVALDGRPIASRKPD